MAAQAPARFLADIRASTMTIEFKFEGLELELEDFVGVELTGHIMEMNSSVGKSVNPNYPPPPVSTKVKRGRKKKVKTTDRCKGGHFGSQMQSVIASTFKPGKVYKVKCFKTGTGQVPGVLDPYYTDVMPAIEELRQFICKTLGGEFPISYIRPLMRNYVSFINEIDYIIDLRKFTTFITDYCHSGTEYKEFESIIGKHFAPDITNQIMARIPVNRMRISRIQYDPEKYSGVKLSMFRPVHGATTLKEKEKILTIKVLQSGKINFDGNRYIWEIESVYEWLSYLFSRYGSEFLMRRSEIMAQSQARPQLNLSEFLEDGTPRPIIYIN